MECSHPSRLKPEYPWFSKVGGSEIVPSQYGRRSILRLDGDTSHRSFLDGHQPCPGLWKGYVYLYTARQWCISGNTKRICSR